jgi:type I restriction enzyme S subunit
MMMREDWIEVELGDVCDVVSGKNQKNVENPNGKYPIYGSGGIFGYADDYLCESGTTIIGRKGTINSPIYVNQKFWNVDTAFGISPLNNIDSKYIHYLCVGFDFKKLDKSTTIPSLAKRDIVKIKFPLAPLPEQRAIAAKIEQLFSELDNGIANLKAAKSKLEIYRQAILKQAFEGKLTNPKNQIQDDLPKNWKWVKLGEVAEVKRGKSKHRPRNDKQLFGGKYPFIQTGDVKAANGGLIRNYSQTYSDFGLAQSKLWQKGTLCLTIAANIADTAFLGFDACFPDSVVGISSDGNVLSLNFLNYLIQKLKVEIDSKASATAQKNINVEFLDKLLIPFCPIEEQKQIVQEIETRLSVCDKLNESIDQSLEKAQALRQSILKKAFEGKLLSQDELQNCRQQPDWEPAAKLLERVKNKKNQ